MWQSRPNGWAVALLDTWPAWQRIWACVADAPIEAQIDAWATAYMAAYPALLNKQVADYAGAGVDWREVARKRVFPFLAARTPGMAQAHAGILRCYRDVATRSRERLGTDFPIRFVVYVGLECGAGWATTYEGAPACLLGLEAIANLGWQAEEDLCSLIAHELGHLAHMVWREQAGVSGLEESEADPYFQLYSEGLAQWAEHATLDYDTRRMSDADGEWLAWCQSREGWLAGEFLRRADAGLDVRDFFGSWYDIEGHSQVGYYLGQRLVAMLAGEEPRLRDLAVWPADVVRQRAREALRRLAAR